MCRVMSKKRRSADMPVFVCDSTYARTHTTHTRAHTHAHILKKTPGRAAARASTGDPRLLSGEEQSSSVSVQSVESECFSSCTWRVLTRSSRSLRSILSSWLTVCRVRSSESRAYSASRRMLSASSCCHFLIALDAPGPQACWPFPSTSVSLIDCDFLAYSTVRDALRACSLVRMT